MLAVTFYANGRSFFDGGVFLYRRQSKDGLVHPIWQVRFKLPGRKGYCIQSCKTKNYEDAYAFAKDEYLALQQKIKDGVPLKDWTFEQHWWDWYERQSRKGCWTEERRKWHLSYFKRYFKSYFGDRPLREISGSFAQGYWEFRTDYWKSGPGKKLIAYNPKRQEAKTRTTFNAKSVPSAKTFQMEQSALNQIFEDACQQKRMPYLRLKTPKSRRDTRRPAFTDEEYALLRENLQDWATCKGRYRHDRLNPYLRNRRVQLACYVGFLAESGIRVGEARKMRWEDISFPDGRSVLQPRSPGAQPLYCHVRIRGDTKTGSRITVTTEWAWQWLGHWLVITSHKRPQDHVWQGQPRGSGVTTQSGDLNKTFQAFLKTVPYRGRPNGLLCDEDGQRRSLYSLRHTYATDRLLHAEIDPLILAGNMGTSVAQIERHYSHVTNVQNAHKLVRDRRRNENSDEVSWAVEQAIVEAQIKTQGATTKS